MSASMQGLHGMDFLLDDQSGKYFGSYESYPGLYQRNYDNA